ncbi:metallophosphoesterase family protein [candidate division KSB1 bacterium]|nr:metallophosphoesterase family protein [candidate division KSB1 bacterium]
MTGEARDRIKIGILSDTHGTLPAEIFTAFDGVDRIIHAGDIGSMTIIAELTALAPVTAVYGNCDDWSVRSHLKPATSFSCLGFDIQISHFPRDLRESVDPDHTLIVWGHTHRAEIRRSKAGLVINPGSACKPRGDEPATVALLTLAADKPPRAKIVELAA